MRCDEVAALLPSLVDGVDEVEPRCERHVQQCLRCQTDLVRYRKLVRNLELLRTRYLEPTPGLLGDTLAALERRGRARARSASLVTAAGWRTSARSAARRPRPRPPRPSPIAPVARRADRRCGASPAEPLSSPRSPAGR